MKKTIALCFGIFLLAPLSAQHYTLAPAESEFRWTGYAAFSTYALSGRIQPKSGTLRVQEEVLTGGTLVIDMRTLASDEYRKLTKHLKSADFFDVANYPTAVFTLTESARLEKSSVKGRLQIKATEREEPVPLEIERRGERIILRGKVAIDRTAYQVNYNSPSIFQNIKENAIADSFELVFRLVFHPVRLLPK